jgi:uncharacterized protein YqfA (UPF0365 family)
MALLFDSPDIPLDFKHAAAIDLAGRNVLEEVLNSVKTKGIGIPRSDDVADNERI